MYQVTVLTSSRADYSIYKPLLQVLAKEPTIALQIIAFGTHTSANFGNTVNAIRQDGFEIYKELPFVLDGSSSQTVSKSIGKTIEQFSAVWDTVATDLVICLGDRYEMFAAVTASVPFAIPVLHIHGGETTLGAMDNVFRHSLTHMASLHFASCEAYRQRIIALTGNEKNVFTTGALSIDNLTSIALLSVEEFKEQFGVNMEKPTILTTFHPETVSFTKNEEYAKQLVAALQKVAASFQIIVTMPNADTMGNVIRKELEVLANNNAGTIFAFESLGTVGYLTAMKYCAMLVGNTSSGFVEASYFPKWVINLGNRQDGRLLTENIRTIGVEKNLIVETINALEAKEVPAVKHPYGNGQAATAMKKHILNFLTSK